jgi:putative transposase
VTPSNRHHGEAEDIQEYRRSVYQKARDLHPERFPNGIRKWDLPLEVTLNPEKKRQSKNSDVMNHLVG